MNGRRYLGTSAVTLLLFGMLAMADDQPRAVVDFARADAASEWQTLNDGVMGGVSVGKLKITDTKTMEFFGTISLENNGGFASVRTKARKLGLQKGDTLIARVRGDGRVYSLNLYIDKGLTAFSYRAALPTRKDEWIEVKLPLDKFEATALGQVIKEFGEVEPAEVLAVGFLLGDKKAGPFKLEVDWIKAQRAGK
jgi:NADH dehydrogenase [ubiquinone] 1 alpha subcomplex assembly factor 1